MTSSLLISCALALNLSLCAKLTHRSKTQKERRNKIAESGKGFKITTLIVGSALEDHQGRVHGKKTGSATSYSSYRAKRSSQKILIVRIARATSSSC